MTTHSLDLLPGVPQEPVWQALSNAAGKELASGKFAHPDSSAALAINAFGWFLEKPVELPSFPGIDTSGWDPQIVDVEREVRFPWRGGRHPWLDAVIETSGMIIGVESKRHEPFRDRKRAQLSPAYDRDVWGEGMDAWCAMRDRLREQPSRYLYLDAAQLVKHAFGLVTEAGRLGKIPHLHYLFAEPNRDAAHWAGHRLEIRDFADAVAGSKVQFSSCSYREWLASFNGDAGAHAQQLLDRFNP